MKKIIIINTTWKIFVGYEGILLREPDDYEFAEVEIMFENRRVVVFLDTNAYVPFTPLLKELF